MKENYQQKAKELFGNSCYLYCLAYLTGLRQFKEMTKQILEWWYAGYCDDSGFVNSPHKCIGAKDVSSDIQKMIDSGWKVVSVTPVTRERGYSNPTYYLLVIFEKEL